MNIEKIFGVKKPKNC